MDKLVTNEWIMDYTPNVPGLQCLALSCGVAVLVNISQFMCLGRFAAVTFQVGGEAGCSKAGCSGCRGRGSVVPRQVFSRHVSGRR